MVNILLGIVIGMLIGLFFCMVILICKEKKSGNKENKNIMNTLIKMSREAKQLEARIRLLERGNKR